MQDFRAFVILILSHNMTLTISYKDLFVKKFVMKVQIKMNAHPHQMCLISLLIHQEATNQNAI